MSRAVREFDPDELPAPICEASGEPIEEIDRECPARDLLLGPVGSGGDVPPG